MVGLYLQSPICLHGIVLNYAQGQLYLYLIIVINEPSPLVLWPRRCILYHPLISWWIRVENCWDDD
jgi:hypothetical protein